MFVMCDCCRYITAPNKPYRIIEIDKNGRIAKIKFKWYCAYCYNGHKTEDKPER